jgi:hypothetical protein
MKGSSKFVSSKKPLNLKNRAWPLFFENSGIKGVSTGFNG